MTRQPPTNSKQTKTTAEPQESPLDDLIPSKSLDEVEPDPNELRDFLFPPKPPLGGMRGTHGGF